MNILLVGDTHFTDKEEDAYRWNVFEDILRAKPDQVYFMGDVCHKEDHHSAVLVNRIATELRAFIRRGIPVTILCGNHDAPLKGPPYWSFLNDISGITFIVQPTANDRLLMLPHSSDPTNDWALIDFSLYDCIFMHQTVTGADLGNGRIVEIENMVQLPRDIPIYSGHIHYPQKISNIEYVGDPYPINYGEKHPHHMLMLNEHFHIKHTIVLHPIAKHAIRINTVQELSEIYVRTGDMAKIEFTIAASRIEQWPVERTDILEWAKQQGVTIKSIKAIVPDFIESDVKHSFLDPVETLIAFAEAENIEESLLVVGYNLLEKALNLGEG